MFIEEVLRVVSDEFGNPVRQTVKVDAWDIRSGLSMVIQKDSPKNGEYANVWLPYPADSGTVPEIALEYSGESGRHSNTYPSSGLEKGNPVLKLRISSKQELNDLIAYVNAFKSHQPLPEINVNPDDSEGIEQQSSILIDTSKIKFYVLITLCLTLKAAVTHSEIYNYCAKNVISQRVIVFS